MFDIFYQDLFPCCYRQHQRPVQRTCWEPDSPIKTALISCFGDTISIDEENVSITNTALIRRYDLQDQQQQSDHDYIANCCPCIV